MATKDIPDRMVVIACAEFQADPHGEGGFALDWLQRISGQPMKVCYRAMERACDRGFIEYGVSLRAAWPTEKGMRCVVDSVDG